MESIHNLTEGMALVFPFLAYTLPIKLPKNLQSSANL